MEVVFIVIAGFVVGLIAIISIISMVTNRATNKEEVKELRREMDDVKSKLGEEKK